MTAVTTGSPRTEAEPMAFTREEFLRGVFAAGGWFLLIDTVLNIYLMVGVLLVVVVAAFWTAIAALAFGPVAHAIGRGLRRTSALRVHLLAFAGLGLVVGVVMTVIALSAFGGGPWNLVWDGWFSYMFATHVVAATVAVPLGWWHTARKALRPHAPREPHASAGDDLVTDAHEHPAG